MNQELPEGIRLAIEVKALKYSGWLKHVKGLSEEECASVLKDAERNSELKAEYETWIGGRLK